jgi:hypothetical protein
VAASAIAACGSTTRLPEAPSTGALTATSVQVRQTGNAPAQVDPTSATFQLDTSGSLVMHITVTSTASGPVTIAARASLYDSGGKLIGDAAGGDVNLAANAPTVLQLNGPAPNGTIAAATVEVTSQASPTPTAATPQSQLGTPTP